MAWKPAMTGWWSSMFLRHPEVPTNPAEAGLPHRQNEPAGRQATKTPDAGWSRMAEAEATKMKRKRAVRKGKQSNGFEP